MSVREPTSVERAITKQYRSIMSENGYGTFRRSWVIQSSGLTALTVTGTEGFIRSAIARVKKTLRTTNIVRYVLSSDVGISLRLVTW